MNRAMQPRSTVWALLFALALLGISTYWAARLWRQPIWNPLVVGRANDAISSMPAVLGSPKVKSFVTGPGLVTRMLGLGSCGAGFFLMEEALARRIEKEGLSLFADATKGRGYREHDHVSARYLYAPWQETPIAASWNWEGTYTRGLQCMNPTNEIFDAVRKAISEPGGYFTFRSGAQILVLPNARIILLTFS
jgi:hypothetical protein